MKKFLAKLMTLPVEKQRAIIAEATRNLERQISRGASHSTPAPALPAGTVHWTGESWNK